LVLVISCLLKHSSSSRGGGWEKNKKLKALVPYDAHLFLGLVCPLLGANFFICNLLIVNFCNLKNLKLENQHPQKIHLLMQEADSPYMEGVGV